MVLVAEDIRIAIEEGCTAFDLLKGDYAYKYRFGAVPRAVQAASSAVAAARRRPVAARSTVSAELDVAAQHHGAGVERLVGVEPPARPPARAAAPAP